MGTLLQFSQAARCVQRNDTLRGAPRKAIITIQDVPKAPAAYNRLTAHSSDIGSASRLSCDKIANEGRATISEDAARRSQETDRGRNATRPSAIPIKGWKDVISRIWVKFGEDRVTLVAAGCTFFLLLALFPALSAFVSFYGFVADPQTIADQIAFLGGILPSGSFDLVRSQIESLAAQDAGALRFGFMLGLGLALWSANNGIKALFMAMNVAYSEYEKRSLVKLTLTSMAFTFGVIFIGILLLFSVGVIPAALALLRIDGLTGFLIYVLRWPILFVVTAFAIALIYRFGPSRENAKWRWLSWGSVLATVVWLAASIGFSIYLENFADYNATYGALGAVIGFMMWTWISVLIVIMGAQLNAELEHQTARDSTTGASQPIGERGAIVADTVGKSSKEN